MNKEYRQASGINWSTLKHMKKSPLDYFIAKTEPSDPTDYMKLGSFVDCGLLTPQALDKEYFACPPIKWGNKADKAETVDEWVKALGLNGTVKPRLISLKKAEAVEELEACAKQSGKTPVPRAASASEIFTWDKGERIINANKDKAAFKKLMAEASDVQVPLFATCEVTGLELKGLADVLTPKAIVDLKTIGTLGKIFYNIRAFDYLGQLAYYDYLLRLNGVTKSHFWFCFVETTSPYKMRFVEIDPRVIEREHAVNISLLKKVAHCIKAGEFTDGSETADYYEYRDEDTSQEGMGERAWLENLEKSGQATL